MIERELLEVIRNFEEALAKRKMPDFNNNNLHRVEQVLRILKVDHHNFWENENKRGEQRHIWSSKERES